MTDLFEHAARLAEARAAKVEGMATADAHADVEWSMLMDDLVVRVAREKAVFTADDVFDVYEQYPGAPTTHDARAFGPVMLRAARNGVCRKTDRVAPSRRKSLHASPRAIWESLIHVKI